MCVWNSENAFIWKNRAWIYLRVWNIARQQSKYDSRRKKKSPHFIDPACEYFDYTPVFDLRDLIHVDDVMEDEDLKLGPNGALVFCLEYLTRYLPSRPAHPRQIYSLCALRFWMTMSQVVPQFIPPSGTLNGCRSNSQIHQMTITSFSIVLAK